MTGCDSTNISETPYMKWLLLNIMKPGLMMVQAYNPCYLGRLRQEDQKVQTLLGLQSDFQTNIDNLVRLPQI